MSGKGDTPRPLSVSADAYGRRWERTFGRCPECAGYEMSGYDKRGRPIPCGTCNGRSEEAA